MSVTTCRRRYTKRHRCAPLKRALVALLGALILDAIPARADIPPKPSHSEANDSTERSLSYSTYVHLREKKAPAKITFYCNPQHSENSVGTLGFRIEIDHYTALEGFHFSDFEGPGAPALAKPLMKVVVQRSSNAPISFETAPTGFVSSAARSDEPFFGFMVTSPSYERSAAKEILRALSENARALEISITDARDPSIKLVLAVPVAERAEEFAKLVEHLD